MHALIDDTFQNNWSVWCKLAISKTSENPHGNTRDRDLSLVKMQAKGLPQWVFTYSKLTIETLEQGVKYVQS